MRSCQIKSKENGRQTAKTKQKKKILNYFLFLIQSLLFLCIIYFSIFSILLVCETYVYVCIYMCIHMNTYTYIHICSKLGDL